MAEQTVEHAVEEAAQNVGHAVEAAAGHVAEAVHGGHGEALGAILPIWTIVPFVLLLGCVAVLPLVTEHFWHKNRNKAIISAILSIPVIAVFWYYGDFHPLQHELTEYFSFIVLLGSLFVVSGGIYLSGDIKGRPMTNVAFLAIGGVLANLLGTTGASMVLIRPMLRTNQERHKIAHIPIFFIFIVSNVSGCLLPIGDPPLFMGFLRGVPFFWTLQLWPQWLFMMGLLLAAFYVVDRWAYRHETKEDILHDEEGVEPLGLHGKINILFLAGILLSIILKTPLYYREAIMVLMAVLSMAFTKKAFRDKNEFNWEPIVEVAVLFIGIFITMVPALEILREKGSALGVNEPWEFFWITGILSSFLDNTPTYLVFFEMAKGLTLAEGLPHEIAGMPASILVAISIGAVFMGAMTYIGNGPNFMVKAICEHQGVKMPSFFGYMVWSVGILVPLLIIVTFVFF